MPPIRRAVQAAIVGGCALVLSCAAGGGERSFSVAVPRGLELYAPVPEGNPLTVARVELGHRLFFDPELSVDRSVSCASCHRPEHAFADTVRFSLGAHGRATRRNTPTLLNVAYARALTLDGRSATLEEQVLKPIQDPREMDLPLEELARRLGGSREYQRAFRQAYGEAVSAEGVAYALSAYLRSLRSGDAPIDRFRGGDREALSPQARQGFELFVGKARCSMCHAGPMLNDGGFHNTGVAARSGSGDPGRFAITGDPADAGAFRTPTLRNVALTAPYMHDGSFAALEEVIEFYDGGGFPNPNLSRDLRPLGLSDEEKQALLAFLRAL